MSGPAIRPTTQGSMGWRPRILELVKQAGAAGITSPEVAEALGHKQCIVVVLMSRCRVSGHLWRRREGRCMRYFHTATVPEGEGAEPLTAKQKRASLARLAAMRVNVFCEQPSNGPVVPTTSSQIHVDTQVVDGVRVTTCPAMVDTRFTVDPATFNGGAFTAEWRQLRQGGAR